MSRLTDLIAQLKAKDAQLGIDLEKEIKVLSSRLPFGLNFERHSPELVQLPNKGIRKNDKVQILPKRGILKKTDPQIWVVKEIIIKSDEKIAVLESVGLDEAKQSECPIDDLVCVIQFRDKIYPSLISTGKVQNGGAKPFHTVINGENYHVLKALTFTHRGKLDAIYIDPPYNTGSKDWKYNNDYVEAEDIYRHSKWLAMIERRLLIAKDLLNPNDSVLIVTIDEKEYLRLGMLLEQIFPNARIQMISSIINPKGVSDTGGFRRADEYIFFVMIGNAIPARLPLSDEWSSSAIISGTYYCKQKIDNNQEEKKIEPSWTSMMRRGTNSLRKDRPLMFYPIYVDPINKKIAHIGETIPEGIHTAPDIPGLVTVLPIRSNGEEGYWQVSANELKRRIEQGRVKLGRPTSYGYVVNYLPDGAYKDILSEKFVIEGRAEDGSLIAFSTDADKNTVAPTQWKIASHNASEHGSTLLKKMLVDRKFPFPKSLYAVEDTLRFFVSHKKNALILDFFSGSGTTAHAVMRLNKQDGGSRQCISVTNNEVSDKEEAKLRNQNLRPGDDDWEKWGICEYITKPRIKAAITGLTPEGNPIHGDYKFNDEFPMSDGLPENAEFFTLSYERKDAVSHHIAFKRIAPLLWMRAGSCGRRIDEVPVNGWDIADTYGIILNTDLAQDFCQEVKSKDNIKIIYIVTEDEPVFQSIVKKLPKYIEPVRLYSSYLNNFSFTSGGD